MYTNTGFIFPCVHTSTGFVFPVCTRALASSFLPSTRLLLGRIASHEKIHGTEFPMLSSEHAHMCGDCALIGSCLPCFEAVSLIGLEITIELGWLLRICPSPLPLGSKGQATVTCISWCFWGLNSDPYACWQAVYQMMIFPGQHTQVSISKAM